MLPSDFVEETSISLSPQAPPPPERRREQRHLTILRVGALIIDGERELCLVRNISAGGVMAHVYREIAVGTRVEIELKNDEPLAGSVVWEADSNIGVAFDEAIDVPAFLATSKILGDGRRARRPRVEVECAAKVRFGEDVVWGVIQNISQGGVRFDCDHDLTIDSDVVLTIQGFRPLPAVVRWRRDDRYGISFIQVLPIQELCDWLRDCR